MNCNSCDSEIVGRHCSFGPEALCEDCHDMLIGAHVLRWDRRLGWSAVALGLASSPERWWEDVRSTLKKDAPAVTS